MPGNLIPPELRGEFRARFGIGPLDGAALLFCSSAPIAEEYASEELHEFWWYRPRIHFSQYAWDSGFRHQFLCIEKFHRDGIGRRLLAA